jgi:hypothetical protein
MFWSIFIQCTLVIAGLVIAGGIVGSMTGPPKE